MHSLVTWFARNPVAANLLMVFIIAAGSFTLAFRLPLEVFPSFSLEQVNIRVPFKGAAPSEVEEAVTSRIEEAVQELSGIKEMTSVANEGNGSVTLVAERGYDVDKLLDETRQQVDQISDFPEDVGSISTYIPSRSRDVISVIVAGSLPEKELRGIASKIRDDIENLPNVSSVAVSGARNYELSIEVSEQTLSRYGLSLSDISRAISDSSLDLAAGSIRTAGGEVLLRTKGKAYGVEDFRRVVVLSRTDGTRLTLGDIARIHDGFSEESLSQQYNGQRSIEIDVFRTGYQSAIKVAEEVKGYIAEHQDSMPYGVTLGYWRDSSRVVKARLNTLIQSALLGGFLVLLLLSLFLRFWVAVWVFVGIPVSILGGIALMPVMGVTINLLSLFAFILVLGIVVDDAIVTGENIYTHMRRNPNRLQAAIEGTHEVAVPVTFGVLTTVAAFVPLLMIEGVRGQIFAQIPLIVIPVLLFSIVESKLILPSHMSHLNFHKEKKPNIFARIQHRIADGFEWFVVTVYQPVLAFALRNRYAVLATFAGGALLVINLVSAGHVRFIFFPRVQSETAQASLEMPAGTPFEVTQKHIDHIASAVFDLQKKYVNPDTNESVIENVLATAGSAGRGGRGSHVGRVVFEITPPENRTVEITSRELVTEWRRAIGSIPGAKNISYRAEIGRGGSPIDVQIAGYDFDILREVAARVKVELGNYPGLSDITDTFEGGKQEIKLNLTSEGEQLGLTLSALATQVRQAFLGTEVQSFQRERDEVDVIVRYPESERASIEDLRRLRVITPTGELVPLGNVANVDLGRGLTSIKRVDRQRVVNVQADIDKEAANAEAIKADLEELSERLESEFPSINIELGGEAREQNESFRSLRVGLIFVLLVIYTLLAIPFRSYLQPLMVLTVIPFGFVGGVLGHMIMDMSLSIMSYMGMLALCGVVVNDSLVMVDYVNKRRREGIALMDAVRIAGVARFRAIILTSLTTFFGLMPLIFETSTQAQFLIPMAVSLGFGILFATLVTLLLIPVNYMLLEDIKGLFLGKAYRQRIRQTTKPVSST
ncbi:MAG: efflux RND transporter permease subunit [Gammaproteobacteria bacterium]|nr:efflux RND transporter permease subunit [Gammaproteobacteria bacterium]